MHTSGIPALPRRAGVAAALLSILPTLSGCKSNAAKTDDIVTDHSGYSKITHKPSGHPSYELSPNGCPATWAVLPRFQEEDGSRKPSCVFFSFEKEGIEVDYLLPGEKLIGIDPQQLVNKP